MLNHTAAIAIKNWTLDYTLCSSVGRKTKNIDNRILIAKKNCSLPPNYGKNSEIYKNIKLYIFLYLFFI